MPDTTTTTSATTTITSIPKIELILTGQRLRLGPLLQQAGYTLGIAELDKPQLATALPNGFIPMVTDVRDQLAKSQDDKVIGEAEAKLATSTQNGAARQLREWSRKSASRCKSARRAGAILPEELCHPVDTRAQGDLLTQGKRVLALLIEHAPALDAVGPPSQPLIDEGRARYDAFVTADSAQELTRSATLPSTVVNFYVHKAVLYLGLQRINDAGHEVYAHDPQAASRYNLSILYSRRRSTTATPVPTPPAPGPLPPALPPTTM